MAETTRLPNYIEASMAFENCKKKCCDVCTDETCILRKRKL
jgi:hypothetical protein